MPQAELNDMRINYELEGQGETIVLLHHGIGCTKMWKDAQSWLVERGFRVLTYDRRGFGKSDPGENFREFYESDRYRPYSLEEMHRLVDRLDIDKFHVVGQCEGGVIGVDYAAAHPERVLSLTVASTFCHSGITMAEFNRIKFPKSFGELDPPLREKFQDWHGETRAAQFYEMFRNYGGAYGKDVFDLRPMLEHVQCPALVLYPDRSFLFEVEQGVMFYRGLPKGELAVLPKCGHNTYEYVPDEYVRQVFNFIIRTKYSRDLGMQTCAS
jgi:pimeloyl-ACP methyl ester carboxylesterase